MIHKLWIITYSNKIYLKYKQIKAREIDKNGHIFNYNQFPRASVKLFTDALFGDMPQCNDIVETMQLMNFLLFDGQANKGKWLPSTLPGIKYDIFRIEIQSINN